MKEYNFNNKRYTTWQDESSGIGGRCRSTTYGVYDNKLNRCAYIEEFTAKTWQEAADKAVKLNKQDAQLKRIAKNDKRDKRESVKVLQ